MKTMYAGKVNSPITELAAQINATVNTFNVVDGNALPDAPNIAVIGDSDAPETILYGAKTGNTLSDVTRGFQGTAQEHRKGAKVSRNFTEYDYQALIENILGKLPLTGGSLAGALEIVKEGAGLSLKGNKTSFIALHPQGAERKGYIGFGESTNNNILIVNENDDGNIIFRFNNGDEVDIKTLDDLANGILRTSLYVTANSDSISAVGIGGSNSTSIFFTGDELWTIGEIDLDRTTEVLSIKNNFDNGTILFHDKDGNVKLSDLVKYKNGKVTITGEDGLLKLRGTTHAYMEIYRTAEDETRDAFFGFPNQESLDLVIENDLPTGNIVLKAETGGVFIDDYPIPKIRVSTGAPSGGTHGDIWHQYV